MKCKAVCAIAIVLFVAIGLTGQVSATNRRANNADDVIELLRVNGVANLPAKMAPLIAAELVSSLRRSDPLFSDRGVGVVNAVVSDYLSDPIRSGQLSQQLVPIYEREFTPKEIQELIALYKTPIGRKLAGSLATIDAESAQVGQQWAVGMLPGLRDVLLRRLRSEQLIK